jgi:hypothetical protein
MVKHRQLAPTMGQDSNNPPVNSMAVFNFPIVVAKKGTTLVFGSWICTSDGQKGYHSRLATEEIAADQTSAPNSTTNSIIRSIPHELLFRK